MCATYHVLPLGFTGPKWRHFSGDTSTYHEKTVQGVLPLLDTSISNSSVVEVPQEMNRGQPSRRGINTEDRLVAHEPGTEAVALCDDAALARRIRMRDDETSILIACSRLLQQIDKHGNEFHPRTLIPNQTW